MAKGRKAPVWARGFLRALRGSGNVKAAARAAGIDTTTAYSRRKKHPDFAATWDEAAAAGRAKAAAGKAVTTAPAKVELILRRGRRGDQLIRASAGRWNEQAEATFVAALGQTGCVRRAADACGFSYHAIYYRRKQYPEFAARLAAALRESETLLPEMLTAAGIAGLDPSAAEIDVPKANIDQSIAICRMRGLGMPASRRSAPLRPKRTPEEVRDEVIRRVAAIRRQRKGDTGGDEAK